MSPNRESFQPPNDWPPIGTGMGTLMSTMRAFTSRWEQRAVPSAYGCAFGMCCCDLQHEWRVTLFQCEHSHDGWI